MKPERLVIVDGVRTPFCKMGTELARLGADELGRIAVNALLTRTALDPELIDEAMIGAELQTADLPELDLLIRTSGEVRLSNFLLWQAAYAELLFVDTLWPDFDEECFGEALKAYAARERRFGGR